MLWSVIVTDRGPQPWLLLSTKAGIGASVIRIGCWAVSRQPAGSCPITVMNTVPVSL